MQRLVDKIVNEFQQNSDYVEIGALDGNGGELDFLLCDRLHILANTCTETSF